MHILLSIIALLVLGCGGSSELGIHCFDNPNAPTCDCLNKYESNGLECEPTHFKNGFCCATRNWPDDTPDGHCRCTQAVCYRYSSGSCRCDAASNVPGGTTEVSTCTAPTGSQCCLRRSMYGSVSCDCGGLSCSDGQLVSSCTVDTLAMNCPTDQPRAIESCSVEEDGPDPIVD
jgi:hypothetical protein